MPFFRIIKSDRKLLLLSVLLFFFFFSLIFYLVNYQGRRFSFYFYSVDGSSLCVETRALPSEKARDRLTAYTEELLLGPSIPRALPIFPLGTRVLFCFERDKILFLNVSENAVLDFSAKTLQPKFEILKKNIKANFPHIKDIEFFIEGNPIVFERKKQS